MTMPTHCLPAPLMALVLAVPLALPTQAAQAEQHPGARLRLVVVDDHRVEVHGRGFPDGRLQVEADLAVPHASVACQPEWQTLAQAHGGRFDATIAMGPQSDCYFSCGREPDPYMVTVTSMNGHQLAQKVFACPARPAGPKRP